MADNGTTIAQAYVQIVPSTKGIGKGIESAMGDAGDEGGKTFGQKFLSTSGKILGGTAKVLGVGAAATTAAVVGMTNSAIQSYAEYEQLVGGVETLFGNMSDNVIANSQVAYQTAGLSANEYMETVMGFSASLNQSLMNSEGNLSRSADLSNQIIIDMSDNANKMGSDMGSIQNAYAGFAKQNYTMLDNLKLGYGGTKEEMQRLLDDAEKLSGVKYDISSFADVSEAIHVVQTEMGITGTTAEEASKTISGSVTSMKKAYSNLITGIADDNQDLGGLVDNLVDSIGTVVENIAPRIVEALPRLVEGFRTLIEKLVPILPPIIETLLPSVISAGLSLMQAIVDMLPTLIDMVIDNLPLIIAGLTTLVLELVKHLPEIMSALLDAVPTIVEELGVALVAAFPVLLVTVGELILNLVEFVLGYMSQMWDNIVELFTPVGQFFGDVFSKAWNGIKTAFANVGSFFANIWSNIKQTFANVKDFFREKFADAYNTIERIIKPITNFFSGIWTGIKNIFNKVGEVVGNAIKSTVEKAVNGVLKTAAGIINGFISAINGAIGIINKIPGVKISKLDKLSVPQMEQGGILKKGEVGLLEGNGAEAVVPLDQNEAWVRAVARDMSVALGTDSEEKTLLREIKEELSGLKNLTVVMDSGATVGALANKMDKALGTLASRRERYA